MDDTTLHALRELQDVLADTALVNTLVLDMADMSVQQHRIRQHLKTSLRRTRDAINETLMLLPAVLCAVLLTGCMLDVNKLIDQAGSGHGAPKQVPGVAYSDLKVWKCTTQGPGCERCVNTSAAVQTVYLQGKPAAVQPTQALTVCEGGGAKVEP